MRYLSILIIGLFCLASCNTSTQVTQSGLSYYPNISSLNKGLVWKYYYHITRAKGERKTDIRYIKLRLEDNILLKEEYNAEFKKVSSSQIYLTKSSWILRSQTRYDYRNIWTSLVETSPQIISDSILINWMEDSAVLTLSSTKDGNGRSTITRQTSHQDTIINNVPTHIISGNRDFIPIQDDVAGDTVALSWERSYQHPLGLIQSLLYSDEYRFEYALDEIISLEEFSSRSNHGMHRVAYIDTLQTLDDHTSFSPCYHPDKINDYYNDERAEIQGGKGRLRAMLQSHLDETVLDGESGFLTFRYVVNCNGEVGWFTTEEADLLYQPKTFTEECKMHLFNLLKAEQNWKSLKISGVPRDAYTYTTFKIHDGKIIEILP